MNAPTRTVVRRRWTRRDWLSAAALGSAALGVGGLATLGARPPALERTRGTCRFCLMRCGIEGVVSDGRLVKVEGDLSARTRGFVCEHGFALRELVHSNERVRLPMIRRGDALFEVGWDEALDFIATRLRALDDRTTLALQTGWPFVRHPLIGFLHRFARAFGTPNLATVSSLCEASLRMGQAFTVGSKYAVDLERVKTLVVWGANPPVTAPPFAHLVSQRVAIVVDPLRTALAKEAALHLQPLPGSDGALALGLSRLVLQRGLPRARERFHGLEAFTALTAQYPLERVQQLTSVPAEAITRAAEVLATREPVGIWQGLGVEHHANGVQTVRAITALEALCGRFDAIDPRALVSPPGPHFHDEPLPALYRLRTPTPAPAVLHAAPIGQREYPLFERYNREAQGESFPEAIDAGRVRALVLWGSNAVVTSRALRRAVSKLELLISIDPFLSTSGTFADVVLPSCTFAEAPDIDADDTHVAARGLVAAQGSAKPDFEILTLLARACGLGDWFPWRSFADAMRAPHTDWLQLEGHRPRDDAPADFGTPTGRIELHSVVLEEAGLEPLPVWEPPADRPDADYPLWLVTGPRPRARINSQFAQSPSVRARLREPEALVHPTTGIAPGTMVELVSPHGRVTMRAVVTPDVHPLVVIVPAGWADANPNPLVPAERDPISGFPAFRSARCRLEPQPLR